MIARAVPFSDSPIVPLFESQRAMTSRRITRCSNRNSLFVALKQAMRNSLRCFALTTRKSRVCKLTPRFESLENRCLLAFGDDSVFDVDQFEQNIRDYFVDNSVGFAYAINQNGVTVQHDGWGEARREDDGYVGFTEDTQMTIASVSKTITATSTLKILQDTPGVGIDSLISPFLPANWAQGLNINTITFRELLTHHSGLRRQDWNGDGADTDGDGDGHESASLGEQTSYIGLQQLIAYGIPVSRTAKPETPNRTPYTLADLKDAFSYENANFALLRVMTPYLLGDGAAADSAADPAQFTADAYVEYVSANVLTPMGIDNANTAPADENPTLNYPYPGAGPSTDYGDRTLLAGGEGWWLSADELAKFLHGVRSNDDVLSPATRELMRDGFLGWMNPDPDDGDNYTFSQGMFGTYYSHGGDLNNLHTGIIDFPNGVQASLLINSEFTGAPYQVEALKRSFENAWPEISIVGTAGTDDFEVRLNPLDNNSVDIFLNDSLVVTRRSETLEKLTLSGIGGEDTFFIDGLPNNIEVVLQGGADNDHFTVVDTVIGVVQGDVTIAGGDGDDTLVFNEGWVFGAATYTITDNTTAKSSRVGQIHYGSLEEVTVHGGNSDDAIYVYSTGSGVHVRVFGNGGDDTLVGGPAADFLDGGDGNDTIQGGPGNDTIYGRAGNDFIGGWLGDDLILCGSGNDTASGDGGNDIVVGEAGNDLVAGGEGDDTVTGGSGNDILVGGVFSASASVVAETGNDSLDGGDGADTLYGDSWALGAPLNFGILGGNDTIQGGPGNDTIYGQAGNDFIGGWLGDDLILGGSGNDTASGDDGYDIVVGEAGNDLVAGGVGNDTVTGGSGNDILVGGVFSAGASVVAETGDDSLDGGDGADTLYGDSWALGAPQNLGILGGNDTIQGGTGNDTIYGQAGNDFIGGWLDDDLILGGSGNDTASGDGGNDIVVGEAGNDLVAGGEGNDTVTGGSGNDILIGGVFSAGASVVAETGDDSLDGGDGADTLYGDSWALGSPLDFGILGGNDTIQGGIGNDTIYGQAGNDFIGGWLGDDLILGGSGNDTASGDGGNDIVVGESGNDLVAGGEGNDTVTGGSGNDILVGGVFSAGASVVAETGDDLLDGGSGADSLFGDSWALGAPLDFGIQGGNDTLRGSSDTDLIVGQAGNDSLAGGAGNDTMLGGEGNDLIRGGDGDDQVWGGNGHDLLLGEGGNDSLYGGDGRDVLIGGLDADTLDGGADDDILIAGTTAHDADDLALVQILDEWTSARDYQTRVKNLKGTGNGPNFANRLNGMVFLKKNGNGIASTVFDDEDHDTLTGSTGSDWFLSDNLDDLLDRLGGETKN